MLSISLLMFADFSGLLKVFSFNQSVTRINNSSVLKFKGIDPVSIFSRQNSTAGNIFSQLSGFVIFKSCGKA